SLVRELVGEEDFDADLLLAPHRLYLEEVRELRARADVKALAHVTGGGVLGNLTRVLPDGIGAEIDWDAWERPPVYAWLDEHGVDLVVCAGYMHLLRRCFLERFPGRVINTHSAPLPEFPGPHPIHDVLAAGVPETAATVHYVDGGVDTGPVIAAERVPVQPGDDEASLRA